MFRIPTLNLPKSILKTNFKKYHTQHRNLLQLSGYQFEVPNKDNSFPRVLITGSLGQLGLGLTKALRDKYGANNVIASDIRKPPSAFLGSGPFVYADVLNKAQLESLIVDFRIDYVIHFSALLSAVGEKNPIRALEVNLMGFQNVIELAKTHNLRVLMPSTIGAFGPSTPAVNTPDLTIMRPTTIYGITKLHAELLGEYYNEKFGVDFRSARYPGIISADTAPGGGTTDYAVEIFHDAIANKDFTSFLRADTRLPMMYLPDCLKGTIQLLEADNAKLKRRTYNMAAFSFTPQEIYEKIKERRPDFKIQYKPDFRQAIADSWPQSLDDTNARKEWDWSPDYDLDSMVDEMLAKLSDPNFKVVN
ncbi:mitochondrial L-threonine 3-dehydrogenase [Neoconidiobolus thromboides FSU 785]|nr:mitochondrial L-threonine 3-dehydrogenase [Neoconidiobolus thromboides FSU 785]